MKRGGFISAESAGAVPLAEQAVIDVVTRALQDHYELCQFDPEYIVGKLANQGLLARRLPNV